MLFEGVKLTKNQLRKVENSCEPNQVFISLFLAWQLLENIAKDTDLSKGQAKLKGGHAEC